MECYGQVSWSATAYSQILLSQHDSMDMRQEHILVYENKVLSGIKTEFLQNFATCFDRYLHGSNKWQDEMMLFVGSWMCIPSCRRSQAFQSDFKIILNIAEVFQPF